MYKTAEAARIVGVAPKGFYGLYAGAEMECYLPLNSLNVRYADGDRFFRIVRGGMMATKPTPPAPFDRLLDPHTRTTNFAGSRA